MEVSEQGNRWVPMTDCCVGEGSFTHPYTRLGWEGGCGDGAGSRACLLAFDGDECQVVCCHLPMHSSPYSLRSALAGDAEGPWLAALCISLCPQLPCSHPSVSTCAEIWGLSGHTLRQEF